MFQTISLFSLFAMQTMVAAQTPPEITNFAPDDAVICLALTGEAKADPNGAAFERWLAQPEIKDSYLNILDLINEQLEASEPTAADLTDWVPQLVLGNPWIVYVDDPNLENPKIKFVVQLGEFEKKAQEALALLAQNSAGQLEEFEIVGSKFFRFFSGDLTTEYGFHENHLLLATGAGELAKLLKRFDAEQPKWFAEIKAELPLERTAGVFLVDVGRLVTSNAGKRKEGSNADVMKFEEIEKITGVTGFDGDETVTRMAFDCPQNLQGVWKMFDVEPLKKEDYRGVSDSVHSLGSLKLNASQLWQLLLKSDESREDMEGFRSSLEDQFEIDIDKDVLAHLGGHVYSYQQFSLLNPQSSALVGIEIRDPLAFSKQLDKFVKVVEEKNDSFGFDVEETKSGPLYQLVPFEPEMQTGFPGVWFQVVGNELLVALDAKAISSHVRKSGREGGKLTDDPRFARIFEFKQDGKKISPIAIFYLDVNVFIESVYSILPMVLGQIDQLGGTVGFDMDMLPPIEKAMNGVLPDMIALYRTKKGFQMIEHTTLPGISASSGVVIALALPAVQQARNTARRARTFNNLRQLSLSVHNYESTYRSLPPAYRSKDDKKLLSWRVEILPFLQQQELYEKFKHDEPWDSPHNKALIKEMPSVFAHPNLELESGKTVYLGVAGEDSIFGPPKQGQGRSLRELTDGTSNTAMLVEVNPEHAVYWTQPDDYNLDELDDSVAGLKGNWPGDQFIIGLADGSVHSITVSDEVFRQMATIDGGEVVEDWQDD
jgi:hypothetical protein